MDVVSVVCCQRSLRRADHSSRGVLPTAVRRCVWSRNLVNEEAMAHWGLLCRKQNLRMSVEQDNEVRDFWFHCCISLLGYYAAYIGSYRRFRATFLEVAETSVKIYAA